VADVIARNSPWHRAYDEASCVGRLSEEAWFDAAAFIALEAAIVATPRGTAAGEVALPHLFAIFERISLLLACHGHPLDVYHVTNLDDEAVSEIDRRVRHVFRCWFAREAITLAGWDPVPAATGTAAEGGAAP